MNPPAKPNLLSTLFSCGNRGYLQIPEYYCKSWRRKNKQKDSKLYNKCQESLFGSTQRTFSPPIVDPPTLWISPVAPTLWSTSPTLSYLIISSWVRSSLNQVGAAALLEILTFRVVMMVMTIINISSWIERALLIRRGTCGSNENPHDSENNVEKENDVWW